MRGRGAGGTFMHERPARPFLLRGPANRAVSAACTSPVYFGIVTSAWHGRVRAELVHVRRYNAARSTGFASELQ